MQHFLCDSQVVVKNTGHSYNSASTARGSLMIWTALMRSTPTINTDYRNTCGQHISELSKGFGRVEGDVPQASEIELGLKQSHA